MLKNRIILITFILLFSFSLLLSETIIVDINGGGDYTTIQGGINAASNGDTVLVYPGNYYENINYNGKDITVASKYLTTGDNSYIDSTIIDGNQNGSVVTFDSGEDTTAVLCGFTIQNGSGTSWGSYYLMGGGIYNKNSGSKIKDCVIKNNNAIVGGGIFSYNSDVILENVIVCHNHSFAQGGGLHLYNTTMKFSSISRCNIYNNYASNGCDIDIYEGAEIDIIVDTFTVIEPDYYFISSYPENNYTLDILNARIEPVNQDLYVSPDGDNANSGLSENEPLKSISWALTKIASDSTHPNTIHLSNGVYSPSLTNEMFPLNCRSYVSIIGQDEESTIMNGEDVSSLIWSSYGDNHFSIENLTIQNGNGYIGGGIRFRMNSSPTLKNVTLVNNNASTLGGAFMCNDYSSPIFDNVSIINNSARQAGAGEIEQYSNPLFLNCRINGNIAYIPPMGSVGGIICGTETSPVFINSEITNNNSLLVSSISAYGNCNPIFINCTICDNFETPEGTIRELYGPHLTLINCILRNFNDDEIYFSTAGCQDTVTISYTNIDGGIDAINTNNNGTINWLEGNIDSIPQFVGGDPFSYELLQGSPCIDAGNPDTTGLNLPPYDLAGNPRIYNGIIDMGAYEWPGYGVDEPDTSFINKLYLFQNKPNPFSSSTKITFISADYERLKDYELSIYNAKGQLIKTYNGRKNNFWVKTDIVWDGKDEDGKKVSPGVYFYKLSYGKNSVTKKMILVR